MIKIIHLKTVDWFLILVIIQKKKVNSVWNNKFWNTNIIYISECDLETIIIMDGARQLTMNRLPPTTESPVNNKTTHR